MTDLTITASDEPKGRIRYELGPANWGSTIPDLRSRHAMLELPTDRLVDIVILGDGYTTEADFRTQLERWLRAFFALRIYNLFAGAFRIRALFTPSAEPASGNRASFFRVRLVEDGDGIARDDGWWDANDANGNVFRRRLWQSVDSFADVHLRRYSNAIDVGDRFAIRNRHVRDTYRNLVITMLVRTADTENVSGMTTNVRRDPAQPLNGRVAFGAHPIHEFSHAFAFLSDEYIDGRDTTNDRRNPDAPSILTLSNLTFSERDDSVTWAHLAPTGRFLRTGGGSTPPPLVGWLWVGGTVHSGAWHSEYRCLMNGTHANYAFTQVASGDPTANPDGSYTEENGASLRDRDRFCAWCQEIVTIRLLEKTDQLRAVSDPADPTEQGRTWFARWVDERRDDQGARRELEQRVGDGTKQRAVTFIDPGAGDEHTRSRYAFDQHAQRGAVDDLPIGHQLWVADRHRRQQRLEESDAAVVSRLGASWRRNKLPSALASTLNHAWTAPRRVRSDAARSAANASVASPSGDRRPLLPSVRHAAERCGRRAANDGDRADNLPDDAEERSDPRSCPRRRLCRNCPTRQGGHRRHVRRSWRGRHRAGAAGPADRRP